MSDNFDTDLAQLDRIRQNHTDCDVYMPVVQQDIGHLLEFIDKLWREYSRANEARFGVECGARLADHMCALPRGHDGPHDDLQDPELNAQRSAVEPAESDG